jgi:hypothetical protein
MWVTRCFLPSAAAEPPLAAFLDDGGESSATLCATALARGKLPCLTTLTAVVPPWPTPLLPTRKQPRSERRGIEEERRAAGAGAEAAAFLLSSPSLSDSSSPASRRKAPSDPMTGRLDSGISLSFEPASSRTLARFRSLASTREPSGMTSRKPGERDSFFLVSFFVNVLFSVLPPPPPIFVRVRSQLFPLSPHKTTKHVKKNFEKRNDALMRTSRTSTKQTKSLPSAEAFLDASANSSVVPSGGAEEREAEEEPAASSVLTGAESTLRAASAASASPTAVDGSRQRIEACGRSSSEVGVSSRAASVAIASPPSEMDSDAAPVLSSPRAREEELFCRGVEGKKRKGERRQGREIASSFPLCFFFFEKQPRILFLSPLSLRFRSPPAQRRRPQRHAQALEPCGERADGLGRRDGGRAGLVVGIDLGLLLLSRRSGRHFPLFALALVFRGSRKQIARGAGRLWEQEAKWGDEKS